MSSWSRSLPELGDVEPAALDPARIEQAVRDGYAQGFDAGRADGWAAGHADGMGAGALALQDDARQLRATLLALRDRLHGLDDTVNSVQQAWADTVTEAALTLTEAVLGREVRCADDPGRDAIVRALAAAPVAATRATVRLHPDDLAHLGGIDDLAPGTTLDVVADATVAPGDCVLTMGPTSVDATVKSALARAAEVLRP